MRRGLVCVALAVPWSLVAVDARAGECSCLPEELFLASSVVARDGVLAFRYVHSETAYEHVEIRVFDAAGVELAGALEVHAPFATVAWRPIEPWPAPGCRWSARSAEI